MLFYKKIVHNMNIPKY